MLMCAWIACGWESVVVSHILLLFYLQRSTLHRNVLVHLLETHHIPFMSYKQTRLDWNISNVLELAKLRNIVDDGEDRHDGDCSILQREMHVVVVGLGSLLGYEKVVSSMVQSLYSSPDKDYQEVCIFQTLMRGRRVCCSFIGLFKHT